MPNVIGDITTSLDGFVTGEHADEQQELGDPPEPTREHAAGFGDTEILEHANAASGAVVRGRRFSTSWLVAALEDETRVPSGRRRPSVVLRARVSAWRRVLAGTPECCCERESQTPLFTGTRRAV